MYFDIVYFDTGFTLILDIVYFDTGFTKIAKELHISFDSFHKGLTYLLNISTKLLPFYPLGFRLYSQYTLLDYILIQLQ